MVNNQLKVKLEYTDGFREGFLQGFMAATAQKYGDCGVEDCPKEPGSPGPCDHDDCGRRD